MSASREKQARREQASSGVFSPKTAQEAKARKEERRNNILYALVGIVLLIIVVCSAVWNSNIIPRVATAVSAAGKNYTAAQTDFYYHTNANSTINRWGSMASYIGLNTGAALDVQNVSESTAELLDTEPGITWAEYFLQKGIEQMVSVDAALAQAKAEGYTFSDTVETDLQEIIQDMTSTAGANGLSLGQYLKTAAGSAVTESLYRTEMRRYLQYQEFATHYNDSLTYTEEELEAAYQEDPDSYDLVSYQTVFVHGEAEATEDEDGNTVEPTEEESAAAMEAAKARAEEILAAYQAGETLESLANGDENVYYYSSDGETKDNLGEDLGGWLYDSARQAGDIDIIPLESGYYVAVFLGRGRDEQKTIDIRHILIRPEEGELTSEDEGYEEEQETLNAAAEAKAQEIYQEWKDGEATEESFAALAMEYSDDGNASDGGIYRQVYEGQMVPTFNDWCFDPARKPGDNGIVETDYGFHIMYYVSDDQPRWMTQVSDDLKTKDFSDWSESLYADANITRHSFGMSFVE